MISAAALVFRIVLLKLVVDALNSVFDLRQAPDKLLADDVPDVFFKLAVKES